MINLIPENLKFYIIQKLNEEEEKIVLDAIDKVGYSKLKDIKEIVSDKISYDTIRAVVLKKIINELNN